MGSRDTDTEQSAAVLVWTAQLYIYSWIHKIQIGPYTVLGQYGGGTSAECTPGPGKEANTYRQGHLRRSDSTVTHLHGHNHHHILRLGHRPGHHIYLLHLVQSNTPPPSVWLHP